MNATRTEVARDAAEEIRYREELARNRTIAEENARLKEWQMRLTNATNMIRYEI